MGDAQHRPVADVDRVVPVAGVEAVAGVLPLGAPVLEGEPEHAAELAAGQVDLCDGVVLLQGAVRGARVAREGDVPRLDVLGQVPCVGPEGAERLPVDDVVDVEVAEADFGHLEAGRVDEVDGAYRVVQVVVGRLTLVGHHCGAAVGGEEQRVREEADLDVRDDLQGLRVQEHRPAPAALSVFGGDGHPDQAVLGADAVDPGPEVVQLDLLLQLGVGGVGDVYRVQRALRPVGDEQPFGGGVVGDDLCPALVELGVIGGVAADLGQLDAHGATGRRAPTRAALSVRRCG